jgi:predicted phosphoribosyltransferase
MPFRNRAEAGRKLATALARYESLRPVVFALPRGGVPVAAEVALALDAPLDLILVRKLGLPSQPELAMGAIVDGAAPIIVRNEDVISIAGVSEADFAKVRDAELAEIERRRIRYLGGRQPLDPAGRVAIIIDDGIATGATMLSARNPKELVIAVPVAPTSTIEDLRREADTVICVETHADFGAIGFFYADFTQVTDREVIDSLAKFPPPP